LKVDTNQPYELIPHAQQPWHCRVMW